MPSILKVMATGLTERVAGVPGWYYANSRIGITGTTLPKASNGEGEGESHHDGAACCGDYESPSSLKPF